MSKEEQIKIYKKMISLLRVIKREDELYECLTGYSLYNHLFGLCNRLEVAYYSIKKKDIPQYLFDRIMRKLWKIAKKNNLLDFAVPISYKEGIGYFWFKTKDIKTRIKVLKIAIKELEQKNE